MYLYFRLERWSILSGELCYTDTLTINTAEPWRLVMTFSMTNVTDHLYQSSESPMKTYSGKPY